MINFHLGDIRTDYNGFVKFLELKNILAGIEGSTEEFQLDMSDSNWIEGDMCACLGALLFFYRGRKVSIRLPQERKVSSLLERNGFVSFFSNQRKKDDGYRTTQDYITNSFSPGVKGLPKMSDTLLAYFRQSLFEIFWNAIEHSETQHIFSCGQFFHTKKQLDFCITDLGIGIKQKVNSFLRTNLAPQEAIDWAMRDKNTTRRKKQAV